jgi:hypothetical protein
VIDQREIRDTDHGRNQDIKNRLPHVQLLLNSTKDTGEFTFGGFANQHGH